MIDPAQEVANRRRKGWYGIALAGTLLAACVIGVTVYFAVRSPRTARRIAPPDPRPAVVSSSMLSQLTAISRAGLHVTIPAKHASLHAIRPSDRATLAEEGAWQHQKHTLLFIGAGFCPYCAAMRWPVALTLLRFGQLDRLTLTRSSAHDVDPNTPTFGFRQARFTASRNSLDFRSLELMNRQRQIDQIPTPAERALMQWLDRPPYTRFANGIPMIVVGDRMVLLGAPVPPALFKGTDWHQVITVLSSGHGPLWKAVMAETNALTKAVCAITGEQPSRICKAPAVVQSSRAVSRVTSRNVSFNVTVGGLGRTGS